MATFGLCLLSVFMLTHVQAAPLPCEFQNEIEYCYTVCKSWRINRRCPDDRVWLSKHPCQEIGENGKWVPKKDYYYNKCSPVKGALSVDSDMKIVKTQGRKCNENPKDDKNCVFETSELDDKYLGIQQAKCSNYGGRSVLVSPTAHKDRDYFLDAAPAGSYSNYREEGKIPDPAKPLDGHINTYILFCGRADQKKDPFKIQGAHYGYRDVMPVDRWIEEQEIRDLQRKRRYRYNWY